MLTTTRTPIDDTPIDNTPAGENPAPMPDDSKPKVWRAGTLVYTFGGLVTLFFWLLWGDFTWQLKERSAPAILQVLFEQFKASDFVNGLIIGTIPQVLAVLLTPIVSYRSDRHRGPWGRRIPYLLIPTPIAVLAMVGLAYSPRMGAALHHVLHLKHLSENATIVICLGVFWTLFEVASKITNAVVGALINDVVPRPLLGRFYGLFRIFSLAAGMAFGFLLFGRIEQHSFSIFLGIGALYGLSFSGMCFGVKEGEYPPVETSADAQDASLLTRASSAIEEYFRDCFSHSYYWWFFLSFAFAEVAFQPIGLFYVRFATEVGVSKDMLGKLMTVQLFCSLVQAYFVGWLCDKIHPIRVTMIAAVLYAISTFSAFLLVRSALGFGIAFVLCGTIAGFWLTATAPLGPAMLPRAKFATFLSALQLCVSLAVICIVPASGWLLDSLHHAYRFIYLWASFFITLSLLATIVTYRRFMALGGPAGFVPPQ